jgi:hypothetical protein
MRELIFGPLAETLGVVFYVVVTGVLTVVGALAERAGLHDLATGQTTLGVWEAVVGALLIYAAYNVAVHIVLPRVRGADAAI